jgi:Ca-activated chloride channel family protein
LALAAALALTACGQTGPHRAATEMVAPLPAPAPMPSPVMSTARPAAPRAAAPMHMAPAPMLPRDAITSQAKFPDKQPNESQSVAEQPVSTFSVDVDTSSYALVRAVLKSNRLPPREAVRVEEMVNYFRYDTPLADTREQPFRVTTAVTPAPWNSDRQLLHIALRGYDIAAQERPKANVVLLIDTSGSMGMPDRLPLLQQSFRLFVEQLRPDDMVSIVTYAGSTNAALQPTPGSRKDEILAAIDRLSASGSTAGAQGLQHAYAMAERNFDPKAVNRIMLATDGDFNVGITDPRELERFIAGKRKTGVYLSVLSVGLSNYNDALMQRLVQAGNGNAAHIDSLLEARKVLSDELASTMFPIANDVKAQVEFNPARVVAYRLIGYETRMLRREDFNDDKVDAGDIGAGHAVTAIYELTPADAKKPAVDPLRYPRPAAPAKPAAAPSDELAFVKLRYKLPGQAESRLIEQPVRLPPGQTPADFDRQSADRRFATAVAAFAQRLRGEPAVADYGYAQIAELARSGLGADRDGLRAEFVRLVQQAEMLERVQAR